MAQYHAIILMLILTRLCFGVCQSERFLPSSRSERRNLNVRGFHVRIARSRLVAVGARRRHHRRCHLVPPHDPALDLPVPRPEDLAQELVGTVSPSIIKRIVAEIPYNLTEHISTLMASKMRLEEELRRRGEFLVGVHLRGFKLGDDDKGEYYVPVYVGAGGTLRAPSDPKQRMIV